MLMYSKQYVAERKKKLAAFVREQVVPSKYISRQDATPAQWQPRDSRTRNQAPMGAPQEQDLRFFPPALSALAFRLNIIIN